MEKLEYREGKVGIPNGQCEGGSSKCSNPGNRTVSTQQYKHKQISERNNLSHLNLVIVK